MKHQGIQIGMYKLKNVFDGLIYIFMFNLNHEIGSIISNNRNLNINLKIIILE